MSFSLFGKKEEVGLLVDIGNGSLSGGLVLFGEKSKPALLYSSERPFSVGDRLDKEKLIVSMTAALGEVLLDIAKKGKRASSALVSFSSPWFASKTKNLRLSQDAPFVITKKFIGSVLAVEEKNFEKELPDGQKNLKIIENTIIKSKINGYYLKNSLGKRTKIFDASIYMSVISRYIAEAVDKQIFQHTHLSEKNIRFCTFPPAAFSVLRDIFPNNGDFLFMDITSESTDITLVLNDAIAQMKSFPSGRNFIIRQMAKSFDVSAEIAESFLRAYNSKKIDNETSLKIESALLDVEKEWSIYFEDDFAEISKNFAVPPNVYMTAEEDVAPIYKNFLKMPKTDGTAAFRKSAEVVRIDEKILSPAYKGDPRFPENEFIGLLAIFFNKIRKNNEL